MVNNLAQIRNPVLNINILNQSGEEYAAGLLPRMVTLGIIIGSTLFMFYLIFGAIRYITSSGDPKNIESAKGAITQALVGLIILFSIFAIATLMEEVFGVDILTIDLSKINIQPQSPPLPNGLVP